MPDYICISTSSQTNNPGQVALIMLIRRPLSISQVSGDVKGQFNNYMANNCKLASLFN